MTTETPAPAEALNLLAAWMAAQTTSETGSRDAEETACLLLDRLFMEYTPDTLRGLAARAEAAERAIDAAIQCETDLLDVYQRHTSLTTLDLAMADLKRDSLPKLKAARAALAPPGVHVISPERREGITPGMQEAAARIARSVTRVSFSLETGQGVRVPAGELEFKACAEGVGVFDLWTTEVD